MKFRPKYKFTVFDKIFGMLLILAFVMSIVLNKPIILSWITLAALAGTYIRDYIRKKKAKKCD